MSLALPLPIWCTTSPLPKLEQHPVHSLPQDPRGKVRQTKHTSGRNSASFDPASTYCRPDLRVRVGSPARTTFDQELKHDDVVLVPSFLSDTDDLSLYYKLIDEIRAKQERDMPSPSRCCESYTRS